MRIEEEEPTEVEIAEESEDTISTLSEDENQQPQRERSSRCTRPPARLTYDQDKKSTSVRVSHKGEILSTLAEKVEEWDPGIERGRDRNVCCRKFKGLRSTDRRPSPLRKDVRPYYCTKNFFMSI